MPTFIERLSTAANPSHHKAVKSAAVATMGYGAAVATGTAGPLAGLGTLLAGAVGVTAFTGGLGIVGVGALLLVPTVLKVVRPRIRRDATKTEEQLNEDAAAYQYWDCHMSRIAILGIRGTGKSTLRQLLRSRHYAALGSTQSSEYYICELKGTPEKYAIILDTAGKVDTAGDQWNAGKTANIVIFVFDHFDTRDMGNTEREVDKKRLEAHELFVREIFDRVRDTKMVGLRRVIFLMSKKDLWRAGNGRGDAERWMTELKSSIIRDYSTFIPDPLVIHPFDREDQNDLQWLLGEIRNVAR
jgi:hypothetical protein